MGSLGQEGSGCSRSMREQSGRAGAKTETWISLFFKLCRCGSAALSLRFDLVLGSCGETEMLWAGGWSR